MADYSARSPHDYALTKERPTPTAKAQQNAKSSSVLIGLSTTQSLTLGCYCYCYFYFAKSHHRAYANGTLKTAELARRLSLVARRVGFGPIWFFRLF
jgi:hypothetical protein